MPRHSAWRRPKCARRSSVDPDPAGIRLTEVEMDRDWWYATKLVAAIVIALATALVVHGTLL